MGGEADWGVVGSALVESEDLIGVTLAVDLVTALEVNPEVGCFGASGRSDLTIVGGAAGAVLDFGGAVAVGFEAAGDVVLVLGAAFAGDVVAGVLDGAAPLAGGFDGVCCGF